MVVNFKMATAQLAPAQEFATIAGVFPFEILSGHRGGGAASALGLALQLLLGDDEACCLLQLYGVGVQPIGFVSPSRSLALLAIRNPRVFELVERLARLRLGTMLDRYDRLSSSALIALLRDHLGLLRSDELGCILLLLIERAVRPKPYPSPTADRFHANLIH